MVLLVDESSFSFNVAGCGIESEILFRERSRLGCRNFLFQRHITMNSRDHHNGAIFTCDGFIVALIWARNSVFN